MIDVSRFFRHKGLQIVTFLTQVEIKWMEKPYLNVVSNATLAELYVGHAASLGIVPDDAEKIKGVGSRFTPMQRAADHEEIQEPKQSHFVLADRCEH